MRKELIARTPGPPTRKAEGSFLGVPGALAVFSLIGLMSCGSFGAVYPPRPAATPGAPVADPTPARVVAHVSVTSEALRAALDEAIPQSGEGEVALLGGARHYSWQREGL